LNEYKILTNLADEAFAGPRNQGLDKRTRFDVVGVGTRWKIVYWTVWEFRIIQIMETIWHL